MRAQLVLVVLVLGACAPRKSETPPPPPVPVVTNWQGTITASFVYASMGSNMSEESYSASARLDATLTLNADGTGRYQGAYHSTSEEGTSSRGTMSATLDGTTDEMDASDTLAQTTLDPNTGAYTVQLTLPDFTCTGIETPYVPNPPMMIVEGWQAQNYFSVGAPIAGTGMLPTGTVGEIDGAASIQINANATATLNWSLTPAP